VGSIAHARQEDRPIPLTDVNRSDLDGAIRLACEAMARAFDHPDRGLPYFLASAWPEPRFAFHPKWCEAHVSGRHLTALLEAESALGGGLDVAEAVSRHERGLFFAFSGELPLPMNRATRGASRPTVFVAHNVREGLHGLASLVRYRNSERAMTMAADCIDAVDRTWQPRSGWMIEQAPGGSEPDHLVSGLGRAIGPLVKLHRASGHPPALALAARIRDRLIDMDAFPADGSFAVEPLGTHVHSITSTMSGLAMLAHETADRPLLDRVRAFVANGLWRIRDELGWAIESLDAGADPDRGEGNTTGDIVETLLILARHGDESALADAERIIRSHLLPSQLRDLSFVPRERTPVEGGDTIAVGRDRLRGLFGFPAPYGHLPAGSSDIGVNLDIVGGVTSSLCAARAAASSIVDGIHRVDILVDHDTAELSVRAPAPLVEVTVTLHRHGSLDLRLGGTRVRVEDPPLDQPIAFAVESVETRIALRHHEDRLWAILRGPDVVALSDRGTQFTFFAPV